MRFFLVRFCVYFGPGVLRALSCGFSFTSPEHKGAPPPQHPRAGHPLLCPPCPRCLEWPRTSRRLKLGKSLCRWVCIVHRLHFLKDISYDYSSTCVICRLFSFSGCGQRERVRSLPVFFFFLRPFESPLILPLTHEQAFPNPIKNTLTQVETRQLKSIDTCCSINVFRILFCTRRLP